MIETELKITLDAAALARLRRHPALAGMRAAPRRTETLVSIYYDTADQALAAAGVALRLRRVGRHWVQTVKRKNGRAGGSGLFANDETECPAPGGRLALRGPDPDGALAAVAEAAAGAPLSPVFETRVERTTERLRTPDGSEVEVALDRGENPGRRIHRPDPRGRARAEAGRCARGRSAVCRAGLRRRTSRRGPAGPATTRRPSGGR